MDNIDENSTQFDILSPFSSEYISISYWPSDTEPSGCIHRSHVRELIPEYPRRVFEGGEYFKSIIPYSWPGYGYIPTDTKPSGHIDISKSRKFLITRARHIEIDKAIKEPGPGDILAPFFRKEKFVIIFLGKGTHLSNEKELPNHRVVLIENANEYTYS
jgi:hypothetical protein